MKMCIFNDLVPDNKIVLVKV